MNLVKIKKHSCVFRLISTGFSHFDGGKRNWAKKRLVVALILPIGFPDVVLCCCWFSDKKIRRKETVVDFFCCCCRSIINSFQHKSVSALHRWPDRVTAARRPSRWSFAPRRLWLASRIRADFLCRAEQPWRLLASLDSDHSTETATTRTRDKT